MTNVQTIAGYIRLSPQLAEEINARHKAEREHLIGPLHGPPIPARLALLRRLDGHPTGTYRRAP